MQVKCKRCGKPISPIIHFIGPDDDYFELDYQCTCKQRCWMYVKLQGSPLKINWEAKKKNVDRGDESSAK